MASASARPALPVVIGLAAAGTLLVGASLGLIVIAWQSESVALAAARGALLFLGALLVSVAGGLLLVRAGALRARDAVVAACAAVPAWTFGALTTVSWGVGMDEADAGGARTWFGDATGAFLLAAWAFGAVACLPPALAAVRGLRSPVLRLLLALVIAVPTSIVIGLLSMQGAGVLLGGAAVLVVASLQGRARAAVAAAQQRTAPSSPEDGTVARGAGVTPPLPAEAPIRTPLSRSRRRAITVASAVSAVLGLGCVVLALAGSALLPALGDATETMRLGILAGSLVAIPVVLAGAAASRPRLGRAATPPAAAFSGALLAVAVSYALDQTHPLSWPALLLAGGLTGLGGALLIALKLPGGRGSRLALVAVITVALAASGGMLIMVASFAAPLLGLLVALLVNRRSRGERALGRAAAA